jgi:hypothetical protein
MLDEMGNTIDAVTVFDLPAELIEMWVGAVYELNPRWNPFREDGESEQAEREKKA